VLAVFVLFISVIHCCLVCICFNLSLWDQLFFFICCGSDGAVLLAESFHVEIVHYGTFCTFVFKLTCAIFRQIKLLARNFHQLHVRAGDCDVEIRTVESVKKTSVFGKFTSL